MSDVALLTIYDVAYDRAIAAGNTRTQAHVAALKAVHQHGADLAVAKILT